MFTLPGYITSPSESITNVISLIVKQGFEAPHGYLWRGKGHSDVIIDYFVERLSQQCHHVSSQLHTEKIKHLFIPL